MPIEFQPQLEKFLSDLEKITHFIAMRTVGHWAVIGSSSLAVHGLAEELPRDINIAMDTAAYNSFCKEIDMTGETTYSPDKCLNFNRLSLSILGYNVTFVSDMKFLTPNGEWQNIHIPDLRTETVIKDGQRFRNILTIGGYMSLAGMFNRDIDRRKLEYISNKTKTFIV